MGSALCWAWARRGAVEVEGVEGVEAPGLFEVRALIGAGSPPGVEGVDPGPGMGRGLLRGRGVRPVEVEGSAWCAVSWKPGLRARAEVRRTPGRGRGLCEGAGYKSQRQSVPLYGAL
jgi:hypothetical protein